MFALSRRTHCEAGRGPVGVTGATWRTDATLTTSAEDTADPAGTIAVVRYVRSRFPRVGKFRTQIQITCSLHESRGLQEPVHSLTDRITPPPLITG